jgi:hypothetical protein
MYQVSAGIQPSVIARSAAPWQSTSTIRRKRAHIHPLARLAGEGAPQGRERVSFLAEQSDAHFFQPSSKNNAQGKTCGASRRRVDTLSRPCRGTLPRQAGEREAEGGAGEKDIARINANGLPRCARNDDDLEVGDVSVGSRSAVARKEAQGLPTSVIARRAAPWQSTSTIRRKRAHIHPLAPQRGERAPRRGGRGGASGRSEATLTFSSVPAKQRPKEKYAALPRRRVRSLSRPCRGTLPRQAGESKASGDATEAFPSSDSRLLTPDHHVQR